MTVVTKPVEVAAKPEGVPDGEDSALRTPGYVLAGARTATRTDLGIVPDAA